MGMFKVVQRGLDLELADAAFPWIDLALLGAEAFTVQAVMNEGDVGAGVLKLVHSVEGSEPQVVPAALIAEAVNTIAPPNILTVPDCTALSRVRMFVSTARASAVENNTVNLIWMIRRRGAWSALEDAMPEALASRFYAVQGSTGGGGAGAEMAKP